MTNEAPATRFLRRANGQRVAYAVHGQGPALVCPAWWVSHLEHDWKQPGFRELFGGLAEHFTVVRYDRPGAGLSDRRRDVVDLAGEVAILTELVDYLELDKLALFAVSCAGPPALAFTAAHPERVSHLVFFGSFLRGSDVGSPEVSSALRSLVLAHWGIGSRTIANLFGPDLSGPEVKQLSRSHREAASPEMAARLLSLSFDVDVQDAASEVQTPVLVIHRVGDRTIRHEAGRELAASLQSAKLLTLEGNAHVPWLGDVASVRDAVLRFLGTDAGEDEDVASTPSAESEVDAANELHRSGDVWTLSFAGRSVHLKHARGLSDLAILLTHPHREVHVAALWSGVHDAPTLGSGADPVLDDEAMDAFRRRLRELDEAVAEAEARGDVESVERCMEEREALGHELRAAVGLGGRKRRLGEAAERARKAVSARIRASIKKIVEVHPDLGQHLQAFVHTGIFCSYAPEYPIEWRFSESG